MPYPPKGFDITPKARHLQDNGGDTTDLQQVENSMLEHLWMVHRNAGNDAERFDDDVGMGADVPEE